jgi:hypothetical protein
MTVSIISHDEYVRYEGDKVISTNTVEGFLFSFQARHEGRLSALQREASAPIS